MPYKEKFGFGAHTVVVKLPNSEYVTETELVHRVSWIEDLDKP